MTPTSLINSPLFKLYSLSFWLERKEEKKFFFHFLFFLLPIRTYLLQCQNIFGKNENMTSTVQPFRQHPRYKMSTVSPWNENVRSNNDVIIQSDSVSKPLPRWVYTILIKMYFYYAVKENEKQLFGQLYFGLVWAFFFWFW
jgi:hypothetical protein